MWWGHFRDAFPGLVWGSSLHHSGAHATIRGEYWTLNEAWADGEALSLLRRGCVGLWLVLPRGKALKGDRIANAPRLRLNVSHTTKT